MPPLPRQSVKEQALLSLTPSCASWLKRVLCNHLRSLWMLLVVLTVVCVAIQIVGVVRQSRNEKPAGEGLANLRYSAKFQHSLPTLQKGLTKIIQTWHHLATDVPHRSVAKDGNGGGAAGYLELSNEMRISLIHVDKTINTLADLPKERSKVMATKLSPPKHPAVISNFDTERSLVTQPEGALSYTASNRSTFKRKADGIKLNRALNPPKDSRKISQGTCQAKKHIVFLKTHKTASSTILNILYRYGDKRNLTFALPLNMHSQLFYPFTFASHFVERVRGRSMKEFHIMCNHMRFRKSEVARVMPKDTFYFSILRHPVTMMESIYIYYKSIPAFHNSRSLDDFLDYGWRSYNTSLTNNHYAHNILAFDFGFDNNVASDAEDLEERARAAIATVERDFHLILISEYFDESMVLLKHVLCWTLDDVVSFKLNSRSQRTRNTLLPQTADKIIAWNALDWRLYQHFNATFWRKVDTVVGREAIGREVSRLRELRAQLTKTCLQGGGAVDPSKIKDTGLKPFQYGAAVIQGYNLNSGLEGQTKINCQNLITPELQYTDILYTKQFPELAARHRKASKMSALQRQPGLNRTIMLGQAWARKAHHRSTVRHKDLNSKKPKLPQSAPLTHFTHRNSKKMP